MGATSGRATGSSPDGRARRNGGSDFSRIISRRFPVRNGATLGAAGSIRRLEVIALRRAIFTAAGLGLEVNDLFGLRRGVLILVTLRTVGVRRDFRGIFLLLARTRRTGSRPATLRRFFAAARRTVLLADFLEGCLDFIATTQCEPAVDSMVARGERLETEGPTRNRESRIRGFFGLDSGRGWS